MNFNQLALTLIEERITCHPTREQILDRIITAARTGSVAFYPCSRCTNDVVQMLQQSSPQTVARIAGIFDNSPDALAAAGLAIYPTDDLGSFQSSLAAVVVTANVFHSRESDRVASLVGPAIPIISISAIDLELADSNTAELVTRIREVVALLADEKSRSAYLLAWLARLSVVAMTAANRA